MENLNVPNKRSFQKRFQNTIKGFGLCFSMAFIIPFSIASAFSYPLSFKEALPIGLFFGGSLGLVGGASGLVIDLMGESGKRLNNDHSKLYGVILALILLLAFLLFFFLK